MDAAGPRERAALTGSPEGGETVFAVGASGAVGVAAGVEVPVAVGLAVAAALAVAVELAASALAVSVGTGGVVAEVGTSWGDEATPVVDAPLGLAVAGSLAPCSGTRACTDRIAT